MIKGRKKLNILSDAKPVLPFMYRSLDLFDDFAVEQVGEFKSHFKVPVQK